MSERRFKDQISDALSEVLPDATGGVLEKWLAPTTESRIEQIPVEQIRDRAWRSDVDTTEPNYRALKASIRASGVLQPLLLRPHSEGGFEVVSGARRFRAARDTAQSTIPAVVRDLDDVQALVGGSWDAVLRLGLTASESAELVGKLVHAGMEEKQATALVATAPARDEPLVVAAVEPETPVVAAETAASVADDVIVAADDAVFATATDDVVVDGGMPESLTEFAAEIHAEPSADLGAEATAGDAEATLFASPDAAGIPDELAVEAPLAEAADLDVTDETTALDEPAFEATPAEAAAYIDIADETVALDEPAVEATLVEAPQHEANGETAAVAELSVEPTPVDDADLDANGEFAVVADAPVEATRGETAELDAVGETVAEPAVDAATSGEPAVDAALSTVADFDFDDDVSGWPAPDQAPADTAPTQPPVPLPLDPTPFPIAPSGADNGAAEPLLAPAATAVAEPPRAEAGGNGVAPAPAVEATVAVAAVSEQAASVQPDLVPDAAAAAVGAPEVTTTDEPAAVTAPDETVAQVGAAPHVIPINLPEASVGVAEEEADLAGSMPVAAPTAEAEAEPGSRLVVSPAPPDAEARPVTARPTTGVPGLLRRGPLFYAVLGIGLAVGAIVFILVSVSEGVGGTTSIIGAVVVAVLGFVTAMVSLAQPRQRR